MEQLAFQQKLFGLRMAVKSSSILTICFSFNTHTSLHFRNFESMSTLSTFHINNDYELL